MSQYLSNVIPNLGNYNRSQAQVSKELESKYPQLNYILVFNPLLAGDNDELDEELCKQIISISVEKRIGKVPEEKELVSIIGVIRGLESFAKNFNSRNKSQLMTIRTKASSIVIQRLEDSFYIVGLIEKQQDESKCETLSKQLLALLTRAFNMFVLFNTSFSEIMVKYDIKVLGRLLQEYWDSFISLYNTSDEISNSKLTWPNSLNHNGFLGLLTKDSKRSYKKSSINYYNVSSVVDQEAVDPSLIPYGMVIACFDKSNTKKYGLIHMETLPNSSAPTVQRDSLIDIYNWLEYFDCHNILQSDYLNVPDGMFTVVELNPIKNTVESTDDSDVRSIRSTAVNAFEMMNPVSLTNNFVILPLNYTMNSVMSFRNQPEQIQENTGGNSWLKIPSVFLNIYNGEELRPVVEQCVEEEELPEVGEFLIGALKESNSNEVSITRKLVYLKMLFKNNAGEEQEIKREHLLVVYRYNDICTAFIYDSSNTALDTTEFYETLAEEIIQPMIEDIKCQGLNGSYMSNTIDSLKSLSGSISQDPTNGENDLDLDFFYLAYDLKDKYFKTSLPYLPVSRELETTFTSGINNAMFNLHDQLIDLFIIQQNGTLFEDSCSINEYFHKFNNTRTSDWMFYYIKHHGKVIIIIKNRNHATRKLAKRQSLVSKKPSIVPKQPSITEGNAPGFLHHISDGVYEYAHLGFLDNLGDDVKTWLENFSFSGDQ